MITNDLNNSTAAAERLRKRAQAAREGAKGTKELNDKLDAIAERLDDMLAVDYSFDEDGDETEDEFLMRLDAIKDKLSDVSGEISSLKAQISKVEEKLSESADESEGKGSDDEAENARLMEKLDALEAKIDELSENVHSESVTLYRNIKADLDAVFQDVTELMREAAKPPKPSSVPVWILIFSIANFVLLGGAVAARLFFWNGIASAFGL